MFPGQWWRTQGTHGFLRNRFDRFVHRGGRLLNEIFHEFGNIGFSFAQWRQLNWENIQPVVQIFAEFTILSHFAVRVLLTASKSRSCETRSSLG